MVAVPDRAWSEPPRTVEAVAFNDNLAHDRAWPVGGRALLDDLADDPARGRNGTLNNHLANDLARWNDDASLDDRAAGYDGPGPILVAIVAIIRSLRGRHAQERSAYERRSP